MLGNFASITLAIQFETLRDAHLHVAKPSHIITTAVAQPLMP